MCGVLHYSSGLFINRIRGDIVTVSVKLLYMKLSRLDEKLFAKLIGANHDGTSRRYFRRAGENAPSESSPAILPQDFLANLLDCSGTLPQWPLPCESFWRGGGNEMSS